MGVGLMALRAGRLRQRVTLMRKTRSVDADGNGQTVWAPIGTPIPAEVVGLNGREAVIGRALEGVASYRITIRHRDGIDDADQLLYGTLTLNIRSSADPDGRREQLQILADTASTEKTSA